MKLSDGPCKVLVGNPEHLDLNHVALPAVGGDGFVLVGNIAPLISFVARGPVLSVTAKLDLDYSWAVTNEFFPLTATL